MDVERDYRRLFREAAQRRCLEIAEDIVTEVRASPLTPRGKTGALADGYTAAPDGPGARISNPAAPYWAHVEYGHDVVDKEGRVVGRAGSRPHVRPAIEFLR